MYIAPGITLSQSIVTYITYSAIDQFFSTAIKNQTRSWIDTS